MSDYAFYSFQNEALLDLGADPLPLPVRREMEKEIFGGEEVRVDLIIEELYFFLDEFPDMRDLYAATMEALAWIAGANKGMEGDMEAAARFLLMGLDAAPDSLLLRSNYAMVLQLQGKGEDALEQYEVVLSDPEGKENPMVRLMAARLYAEQGEYLEAYRLLDDMAHDLPTDDAFWNFLAEMKELAGLEGEEEVDEEEEITVAASQASATCPACGTALRPGARFCRQCGTKVETGAQERHEVPKPSFCPGCGMQLREGARFCRQCGKPL